MALPWEWWTSKCSMYFRASRGPWDRPTKQSPYMGQSFDLISWNSPLPPAPGDTHQDSLSLQYCPPAGQVFTGGKEGLRHHKVTTVSLICTWPTANSQFLPHQLVRMQAAWLPAPLFTLSCLTLFFFFLYSPIHRGGRLGRCWSKSRTFQACTMKDSWRPHVQHGDHN